MPRCPVCQAELPANVRFCPKDGTTLRPDSVLVPLPSEASRDTVAVKTRARRKPVEDPSVDPLIGRVLDGRYRVRGRLGEGGVGAVYEGEHIEIKKTVAIKVLHAMFASTEEFRRRFEREARAASRLAHPACVQVLDFGRVEKVERTEPDGTRAPDETLGPKIVGMPYLVMEYVRGTVLADRIFDGPPLSPEDAVQVTRDVLSALKHAHGLGIVHRDLKPANVMLLDGDLTGTRVKLLDFGLAKELGPGGDANEPLTQAGMVFGTPGYLSPEQAAGRPADERADLYSLGVVLFEMACGRRPFVREDPLDAVRDHMHTPPPKPRGLNPELSEELESVIFRALEKDPAKRFPSAEAFSAALAACPEGGGAALKRRASPSPLEWIAALPKVRLFGRELEPAALGLGALGAVLLLALGIGALAHHPAAPPPKPASPPVSAAPSVQPVPASALHHRELAENYQRKLWCSDAIEELGRALRDAPSLKRDPEMAKVAISCLGPKTYDKAARFLVDELGGDARAPLTAAAAADPNPDVRRAAARTLATLDQPR
ncbi:MAG TPA: serine/threonine-protein kinase [Polyangia bacterium]